MKKNLLKAAFAAAAMTVLSTTAQAQPVSWNLKNPATGGGPVNDKCVITANAMGNSASCDANGGSGFVLTVRGYAFNGSSSTSTVQKAAVNNQGTSGLGMCNSSEGLSCSSSGGNHAVDNNGTFTDFLLLQSAPSLVLKSVTFGWTSGDADFTVLRYTGVVDPLTALNGGASIGSLLSGGWSVVSSVNGQNAGAYSSFNNANLAATSWIIAARNTAVHNGPYSSGVDAFKVSAVGGTVVPEPTTYALMAAGLAGVFGFARRRSNS